MLKGRRDADLDVGFLDDEAICKCNPSVHILELYQFNVVLYISTIDYKDNEYGN